MSDFTSSTSESIKIDGANKSELDVAKQRVIAVSIVFLAATFLVIVKLFYISTNHSTIESKLETVVKNKVRGDILDRNGKILATTLPSFSLYMDATKVRNPKILLNQLANIIPEINRDEILERINKQKKFIYIKRQLIPKTAKKINLLGEPSLNFKLEPLRVYPLENETGYFVGYMGFDDIAHSGIERSYNEELKKGKNILLTIDIRLQSIVYNELKSGMKEFEAEAAVGIILDIKKGEILSAISFPDFNPNFKSHYNLSNKVNRVTMFNYEMGSIFKSFTIASALNEDLINIESEFDATKPLRLKGMVVKDFHPKNKIMNLKEVFLYSSNIGSSIIAMQLGKDKQNHYFKELGLSRKLETGVYEMSSPIFPESYTEPDIATRSYGYGISVNPLQVVAALAATVNDGKYIEPFIVDDILLKERPGIQVFKKEVSKTMKYLYRSVVADEDGTASKINTEKYKIGGKTGTANKLENGKYISNKSIASFVAFFPIDDPKYAIFVLLDNPNPDKQRQATAGWTAVPISKNIIEGIAPILGLPKSKIRLSKNFN